MARFVDDPALRRWGPWLAISVFFLIAAFLVRDAVGVPSIVWMNHYAPQDFPTWPSLIGLLTTTRLPLPPVLTALEILNYQHDGTTRIVTVWIYRLSLVAAYVLALVMAHRSPIRLGVSFVLSVVFLWATTVVHPAGAWVYDILLPALLLGFFVIQGAIEPRRPGHAGLAFLAGLCLALAELTRPHMILLLPLLLGGALARLLPGARSVKLAFLLPVLLLSGGWHLHQYVDLGQVAWSNHGGFNLLNAWPMVTVPPLEPETREEVAPGRFAKIDTEVHGENSRRVAMAVVGFALENPWRAAVHVTERMAILLSAPTAYMKSDPHHWILPLYRLLARYAGLYVLLASAAVVAAFLWQPSRAGVLLAQPENLLLLTTALSIAIVAVADHGEEARFLIMLLPLFAALPWPRLGLGLVPQGWAKPIAGAAVALVVAVELVAAGAIRHPVREAAGAFPPVPQAVRPPTLRLLSLNIRGRQWSDFDHAQDKVRACLAEVDLAALNEVSGPGWIDRLFGWGDQARRFAEDRGMAEVFAPTERRWWRDQLGHAVLTRLPGLQWRTLRLQRRLSDGYRTVLMSEIDWNGRRVSLMTTQIAGADADLQLAEVLALFQSLPAPAILTGGLVKLGDYPALARLGAEPNAVALVNGDLTPGRAPVGEWILARGFRQVAARRCPGPEGYRPGLILELAPAP